MTAKVTNMLDKRVRSTILKTNVYDAYDLEAKARALKVKNQHDVQIKAHLLLNAYISFTKAYRDGSYLKHKDTRVYFEKSLKNLRTAAEVLAKNEFLLSKAAQLMRLAAEKSRLAGLITHSLIFEAKAREYEKSHKKKELGTIRA